jgi:hypothetical protein
MSEIYIYIDRSVGGKILEKMRGGGGHLEAMF